MSFMIANSYRVFKAFLNDRVRNYWFFKKWRQFLRQNVKTRIKNSFRMLVLAKFSEGMMTIYTDECIKNMPTWNHVNNDEVKRLIIAFMLTLRSFITSQQKMMNILFLH